MRLNYGICSFFLFIHATLCGALEVPEVPVAPTALANIKGLPSSLVNNSVSVITGDYCDQEIDLIIPGPEPLVYTRYYCSGRSNINYRCGGWHTKEDAGLETHKSTDSFTAVVKEESGGCLPHRYYKKKLQELPCTFSLELDREIKKNGLTNCFGGVISGRSNSKNTLVLLTGALKYAKVTDGSGLVRIGRLKNYDNRKFVNQYEFFREETPRNHDIIKDHDEISIKNKAHTTTYGSYKLVNRWAKSSPPEKGDEFVRDVFTRNGSPSIVASDGRQVEYKITPDRWSQDYLIDSVNRPSAPPIEYRYDDYTSWHGHRIIEKSFPEGRTLITNYYDCGDTFVQGTKVHISGTRPNNLRNRVCRQKAPVGTTKEPIEIYSFIYNTKERITDVYDALKNKTQYTYSEDDHLKSIRTYSWNGTEQVLHSHQNFIWGKPGTDNASQLISASTYQPKLIHPLVYRTSFEYDERGNVLTCSLEAPISSEQCSTYIKNYTYTNDGFNLVKTIQEPNGGSVHYEYVPHSELISSILIYDRDRIVLREFFEYDTHSVLVKKVVDDGSTPFKDDLTGVSERHITIITPRYEQPAFGLAAQVEEKYLDLNTGLEVSLRSNKLSYTKEGWVTHEEIYDSEGNYCYANDFIYNNMGQCVCEQNGLGYVIHRSFDANGNKITEHGPRPNESYFFTYDYSNRLIRKEIVGDSFHGVETFNYNYLNQCVSHWDHYGNETSKISDRFGNIISQKLPNNATYSYAYDIFGHVKQEIDPLGHVTNKRCNYYGKPFEISYSDGTQEKFTYSLEGHIINKVERNGSLNCFTYDALGRVLREEIYSNNNELLSLITHTYNSFHKISTTDAEGHQTFFEYDGAGRLSAISKEQERTEYCYDTLGRLWKTKKDEIVSIQEYDFLDRIIEERVENLEGIIFRQVQYTYDESGNKTSIFQMSDAGIATTLMEYDLLNRPTKITDPLGEITIISYNMAFCNDQGKRVLQTSTTDSLGQQTIVTFNEIGKPVLTEKKNPFGTLLSKEKYVYDLAGNQIQRVDSVVYEGKVHHEIITRWELGPLGRVEKSFESYGAPEQKVTSSYYNIHGQLEAILKPNGNSLHYIYDSIGRLIEMYSSDDSFHYDYIYNRNNDLLVASNRRTGLKTVRSYNSYGRMTEEALETGITLKYQYDKAGRICKLILPDQSMIEYAYEGPNLSLVKRSGSKGHDAYSHSYKEYDLSGKLLVSDCPGFIGTLSFKHDLKGQLREITSNFYCATNVEYDSSGHLTHYTEKDPSGTKNYSFNYDPLYQLIGEEGHSYVYDSLKNRLNKDGSSYQHNNLNQLLQAGETHYSYDTNGNRILKNEKGQSTRYKYDALDRLVEIQTEGLPTVYYTYDSFHRRLTKTKEGVIQNTLYQSLNDIGTILQSGEITELRILGSGKGAEIGAAVALEIEGKVVIPIHNFHGDIAVLLDLNGEVLNTYHYTAFGEEEVDSKANVNSPWKYSSKRTDEGLIFFGRRFFDPIIGRWLTADPAGYKDGPNLYTYVQNDPLGNVDLYGLTSQQVSGCIDVNIGIQNTTSNYSFIQEWQYPADDIGCNFIGRYILTAVGISTAVCLGVPALPAISISTLGLIVSDHISTSDIRSVNRVVGRGEINPYVRVTYANGMLTTEKDALHDAEIISRFHGNTNVHLCYNATHNFLLDFGECIISRKGTICPATKLLVQKWRELLTDMGDKGEIQHYCHSQGAITTYVALQLLNPHERKRITCFTFGGGVMIPNTLCESATNYVSSNDAIPWFDPLGRLGYNCNVVVLPGNGYPGCDHGFKNDTYQNVLIKKGRVFIKQYGVTKQ